MSQEMFVGAVSDNHGERIEQKIFHAQIVIDHEYVAADPNLKHLIGEDKADDV